MESIFRGTGGLEFGILWYKDVQGPFQRLRADLPQSGCGKTMEYGGRVTFRGAICFPTPDHPVSLLRGDLSILSILGRSEHLASSYYALLRNLGWGF